MKKIVDNEMETNLYRSRDIQDIRCATMGRLNIRGCLVYLRGGD